MPRWHRPIISELSEFVFIRGSLVDFVVDSFRFERGLSSLPASPVWKLWLFGFLADAQPAGSISPTQGRGTSGRRPFHVSAITKTAKRSEERRVGKECS